MPTVDAHVQVPVSGTARARQLEAMFDVPRDPVQRRHWHFDAPYDEHPWNVGLILGPSGAGKTTILRQQFGEPDKLTWEAPSVIDAFDPGMSMGEIAEVCQAVGFNTVPAWLRPYEVLSTGEQFRVELARRLITGYRGGGRVLIDEFTSVVDRQVAKIGAHAVAKYARRHDLRVVAATCHYDVIEWLSPDWIMEPAEGRFAWRSVQPRPTVDVTVSAVDYSAWKLFAPFHYLTAELSRSARCYAAFVDGAPVAFNGVVYRPHAQVDDIWGLSRTVTLPDWQGLGLAFVLGDAVAGAYKAAGRRLHAYPAHPALMRSYDRSPRWALKRKPGYQTGGVKKGPRSSMKAWRSGGRPCAVFEYVGDPLPKVQARALIGCYHASWFAGE